MCMCVHVCVCLCVCVYARVRIAPPVAGPSVSVHVCIVCYGSQTHDAFSGWVRGREKEWEQQKMELRTRSLTQRKGREGRRTEGRKTDRQTEQRTRSLTQGLIEHHADDGDEPLLLLRVTLHHRQ